MKTPQSDTWIMLGSAPTAPKRLPLCREQYPYAKLITCNGGILLEPTPDAYLLADYTALEVYVQCALTAQMLGTYCITIRDEEPFAWCDESFESELNLDKLLSGMLCMEWVCRNGAKQVVIVGCDGYRHSQDYFSLEDRVDGMDEALLRRMSKFVSGVRIVGLAKDRMRKPVHNTPFMQKYMHVLFERWSDVQWIYFGRPLFELAAPNLEIVECEL